MFSVAHITYDFLFTASKRSLRRLCFHRCLSVHRGVSATGPEGMWWQTPPPGRHPPDRHPPGRHLPQADIPQADTPQADTLLGRPPRQTVNKRAVRIPLECIFLLYVLPNTYNFEMTFSLDYRFMLSFTELFLRKTKNPKCSKMISSVTFLSCSTFPWHYARLIMFGK